jgi:hypothetical protein
MKRFTIFTFDNIEDVNDAFGYDCFEDLIQSRDYNALKPFARILKETNKRMKLGLKRLDSLKTLAEMFLFMIWKGIYYIIRGVNCV